MRVLVDIRSLDTPIRSGIPEYTFALVQELLEQKGSDEYFLFGNSFRKRLETLSLKERADAWINWKVPNRLLDAASRLVGLPKIDRAVRADVYFSPHFNILSFKEPRRHVLTIHDISFAYFPEFFPRRKNIWHAEQDWRRQIKEAGKVIAVSDFTRESILDACRVPEDKVVRVYSGIRNAYRPIPWNAPELAAFKKERGLERPFFLYVGTLEPRKNIIGLIRAFNMVKGRPGNRDLQLVIAGAPGWLYDKIFKEIGSSPHRADIKVWGPAKDEEMVCLYNLALAFVYPSFFEGFGFPPLEAQRCGTPVIASNRSSLPEILGASALLVDPYRLEELALAMEAVASDGALREKLARQGIENSSRFSWKTAAGEVKRVFERINN
ncbi:glycosyltransferase family 4 protein [Patescibacteria group bacterium]|nr:glycosyltransferase family 4 protein [Patescibacteria group bacterium]